MYCADFMTRN